MLQAKATCLVIALPAKGREGQRMFGLLHFAWRCAIKIMACGSIMRTLPVEKKALAGMGVLRQWAVAPNKRLHADGFAAPRLAMT
jgi:hypothetical protein